MWHTDTQTDTLTFGLLGLLSQPKSKIEKTLKVLIQNNLWYFTETGKINWNRNHDIIFNKLETNKFISTFQLKISCEESRFSNLLTESNYYFSWSVFFMDHLLCQDTFPITFTEYFKYNWNMWFAHYVWLLWHSLCCLKIAI